ncbi:NAD(+) diphosphatase [Streptomyces sp. NPDC088757]|uniref:NAD(+) diphosphatase n=1 Tax=Streptomyces sp. NPDC088757 TaxID=3365889 RepID=UPI003823550E
MEDFPFAPLTPAYVRVPLDRTRLRLDDPDAVSAAAARPDRRAIPFWRDRCVLERNSSHTVLERSGDAATRMTAAATQLVLLGLDGRDRPVFAADLSARSEEEVLDLTEGGATAPVRALFSGLTAEDASLLAGAQGLLSWNRRHGFCASCGSATASRHGGHQRECTAEDCGATHFPRIEPAVIVLVEAPGPVARCLLARHHGAPEQAYSLLAGFTETGEGLEGTAVREVREEAGVELASLSYRGSQGWPFPAGLMVGFRARARTADIRVDGRELVEARWFTRDDVRALVASGHGLGPPDSLGHLLLRAWLDE